MMHSSKRTHSWFRSLGIALSAALMAAAMLVPTQAAGTAAAEAHVAPFDGAIANVDRLAESLVKQGLIRAGLDPEAKEKAVNKYLQKRAAQSAAMQDKGSGRNAKAQALRKEAGIAVDPAVPQTWNREVTQDKILVLLVEYSDFAHNNVKPGETDMLYTDYPQQHFQDMLFGDNGYTGPNGENLISMRQYYLEQSGGSYTVTGDVYGWFKVSKNAAYYGGNYPTADGSDIRPRNLIAESLRLAVANGVNLADYDQEDEFDLDGDGDYNEPDGIIDHLMVLHAGVGEEAGGGALGADAIWSHSWDLGGVYTVPGSTTTVPHWGGRMGAYAYTVEPEDGATGVFAHEFGHDLGLPDEYDTQYTGNGEPVQYYSIMASGSWAGIIPGAEPTGFSPFGKEYFQNTYGGNWQHGTAVNFADIPAGGMEVTLDQAAIKSSGNDVVRINLPDQVNVINKPAAGAYEYWGGNGDEIDHSMAATVDLTGATGATLDYDIWYNTEANWDFAFVQVSTDGGATWKSLSTSHTTSNIVADGYPAIIANVPGYTGSSNGWLHETVNLNAYAGQTIQLQFRYMTDWGTNLSGVYVDNVKVAMNGTAVLSDNAEADSAFTLNGFTQSDGTITTAHYYLVEWRNHAGTDIGLAHISRGPNSVLVNDPGMLVWYVNGAYDNNWVGVHPGKGYLGVIDSHQDVHHWGGNATQGVTASTRYQIYDASFSLTKGADLDVDYGQGQHIYNAAKNPVATYDDRVNYWTPSMPSAGVKVPTYGLKITVVGEASDRSAATIRISK